MPELPEVKLVADALGRAVVGRRVGRIDLKRADVVTGANDPNALLEGASLDRIDRHGKQLALVADDGRCVCVHLGMTGSLQLTTPTRFAPCCDAPAGRSSPPCSIRR